MTAPRADLRALSGRITFPDLAVDLDGLTLAQTQPSAIRLADAAATIEQLDLAGTLGNLGVTGQVELTGDRVLGVDAKGKINIAAASLVTDRVDAEGDATIDLQARGTVAAPDLTGQVVLTDANLVADEISVAAERINARLDLAGSRVRLETLSADVNGGTLKGAGEASLGAGGIRDINLELTTSDFAYDAPLDLRTLSNGTVRIQSKGEEIVVDGRITVDEGGLTGDINFDTGLLAAVTERRKLDLTEERNPLLDRVRFNVAVDTATPILVDNNLAQAEIDVNVRLLGTPYETGLSGQIEVREGGEIRLNERQLRDGARHHQISRRAPDRSDLRPAAQHDREQLRRHDCGVGHHRRYRDDVDVRTVVAGAGHHGAARDRADARRDARRGVRRRPRADALVSGWPCRIEPRPRPRKGDRSQRSAGRAASHRQRSRSERAADRRPGAHRQPRTDLLDRSRRQQRSDLGGRVRRHAPVPDPRRPSERRQLPR